jgi:MFS family permease
LPPAVPIHAAETTRRRIVILALGVTQILGFGTTLYLPTVLAAPIVDDTGWAPSMVVGGLSVAMLTAGAISPLVGRLVHRHGGRPVMALSSVLLALGLAAQALAPTLPFYLAAWMVTGLGMGSGLYDTAFATLGRLYGHHARSAITAVTLYGGFASTICWPLSAWMVESVGWRSACLVYAALHLLLSLPLHALALPSAARDHEETESAAGDGAKRLDRPLRRSYRILLTLSTTGGIVASVMAVHVIGLLQAHEIAFATAVALAALIGPAQVGGRILEMAFGHRYHPIFTLLLATALVAGGTAAFFLGSPVLALALVLYGGGQGIWSIARGTVPMALFGPGLYPIVIGRLAMPNLIAQAISPPIGTVVIDRSGAETLVALLAAAAFLNLLLAAALWLSHHGGVDRA